MSKSQIIKQTHAIRKEKTPDKPKEGSTHATQTTQNDQLLLTWFEPETTNMCSD